MSTKELLIMFGCLLVVCIVVYKTDNVQYSSKLTADSKFNREINFTND